MQNEIPVLLVNPPAKVPVNRFDVPDFPAIGIAYVAGYLKRNGVPVDVIDGKLSRMTHDQTIEEIVRARPRILGLSSMTHQIVTTHEIAEAVKARCPETIVLLGGFHGSFLPERTLREFPAFDYICVGEGEVAALKFVNAVLEGGDPADVPGIASRNPLGVRLNGRGEIPDDLNDLGMPAWELFPPAKMYPIMSQRGCPFACNFCSRPYGRILRGRTPEHVAAEVRRNYDEFGAWQMNFYDETFTVRKKFVRAVCDAIEAAGLAGKVRYWAFVHANTIDLPTAEAMRRIGFREVGMGVESGSRRVLQSMGKGVSPEDIVRAADVFKKAGLVFQAYFIIGHPNETVSEVKETIELAVKVNPDNAAFGIMTPYPGTVVWEMATKGEGGYKMLATTWEDFDKQIGKALELETLSRKQMERLQLRAYLSVYIRNWRFREMFAHARVNRKRVQRLIKKLFFRGRDDERAAQAWVDEFDKGTSSSSMHTASSSMH